MRLRGFLAAATIAAGFAFAGTAMASSNLISNGNFETGTLAGWSSASTGGSNHFYLIDNGAPTPAFGNPTQINPGGGQFVAVSDQTGGGGEALLQTFTTSGGTLKLSFDWFDNSHFAQSGTALDSSAQVGRVDILNGGSSAFDTGAGVAKNIILNAGTYTGLGTSIPWQSASYTITGLDAGTYQLRFASGECCFFQEFGVDNVVLTAGVPEPTTWAMLILGVAGVGVALRRRKDGVALAVA